MPGTKFQLRIICPRGLRALQRRHELPLAVNTLRSFSRLTPLHGSGNAEEWGRNESESAKIKSSEPDTQRSRGNGQEQGAMSRRLAAATEDAILEGGRAGRKAVEEAGFSEELKMKLLEKVRDHKFRSENPEAFAEAAMTSNAGRGSQDIATSQAWTGTETREDSVLRMLDDARKPLKPSLRGSARIPNPVIDLSLKREPKQRPADRLANARDRTSIYSISKDTQMSEKGREKWRKELKERFTPGARAMPNSLRGLAALANERIEDAIARGQFRNIPRGKAIERDTRADNPFVNTTEYIMNKMIQRQEIVPPWIEKQQELVKTVNKFRARLRNDWKRHAARTIASRGGSLQDQMRTAEKYAAAELVHNPKRKAVEQVSVPTNTTGDPVMVNITQNAPTEINTSPQVQVSLETKDGEVTILEAPSQLGSPASLEIPVAAPLPAPFRIPSWEMTELSYLQLAISNLNSLTRSYNLMAPDLAKKPYFSLERELKSCYADIAPELAGAIKERAARPAKQLIEQIGHRPGSVLERFSTDKAIVYDSKKPLYGFKEFWNDLFTKEKA